MAKTESTLRNMIMALTFIALAAASALGFVYEITKNPIELTKLNKKLDAIKAVVPQFDNNPDNEMFRLADGSGDSLEIYPARSGGELVGYAVRTYTMNGFSGYIGIMAGFTPDGKVFNTNVLEHKETPGLGTKMAEDAFKQQFNSKDPAGFVMKVKKDGGQIDAITAATITSRAFCEAVGRAYDALKKGGLI